ncbi:MAG: imidazole glycerol phosphate synthase subunit HisF [Euryarchaeota archaeon]|nr:imidazole glycerol phosphate synthase subunit HisF [Euryarchaeota archaeon]
MLAKRVIPCLDCDLAVPGGRVVKGREFQDLRYAGVPWRLAARYSREGADEIVFLDITASAERRETMVEVIRTTAREVFIPLTVGGGIRRLPDATRVFRAGADKVSINTSALRRPPLIREISRRYGSQACVVAIDAKRRPIRNGGGREVVETPGGPVWWECSILGGRSFTGVDALDWARRAERLGAGEILLTSMDRDGTSLGYDLDLTRALCQRVDIPVIASGGCGGAPHMVELFRRTDASAALAASIFHFRRVSLARAKGALRRAGIPIRT